MIQTYDLALPHGIHLSCRAAGEPGRPLMVFLHGFPEAAFIWDDLLQHFAQPEHGGFRCVAPNLRGFEKSSAPAEVAAYRAHLLIKDILALADAESADGHIHTLVAHDWGGAFGWGLANAAPERLDRLVIINSPHPGTFARELQRSPEQQAASAYMTFLARPDAEQLLAEDDYRRLWPFFLNMGAGAEHRGWLTEDVKAKYREVWDAGLTGALNLYRVTPLKPAAPGEPLPNYPEILKERVMVNVPTLVLWAMDDVALLPGLIEGLEDFVPQLQLEQVPGATHWLIHEQPQFVAERIERFANGK
jgi:pimeloyl-ACP methyl ester carboxylesterase